MSKPRFRPGKRKPSKDTTVVHVPQHKGELRGLFQEMHERSEAKRAGERGTMIKVKARFTNGTLTPLEPVELKEGDEVTLSIDDTPQLSYEERFAKFKAAAGGWEDNGEYWDNFKEYIYEARSRGID